MLPERGCIYNAPVSFSYVALGNGVLALGIPVCVLSIKVSGKAHILSSPEQNCRNITKSCHNRHVSFCVQLCWKDMEMRDCTTGLLVIYKNVDVAVPKVMLKQLFNALSY